MADTHTVNLRDPVCPDRNCGHRHQPDSPCWEVFGDRGGRGFEACTHAPRCLFCDGAIERGDGHTDVRGGLFIHMECKIHVPAGQRRVA